jgi:hypothetical protein
LLRSPSSSANLLPTLNRLISDNAARVDDSFAAARRAAWLLAAAGVLGLGTLVTAQFWLARRSHRVLNLPLLAATVAVLVGLVVGAAVMMTAQSRADQVRDNSYAATRALANARIAAYVGKSHQSITLIYIGTGGDYPTSQKDYQEQAVAAKAALGRAAGAGAEVGSTDLTRWIAASDELTTAAQTDWISAAAKATSTAPGTVNALFAAFDRGTGPVLKTQATAVDDGLRGTQGALTAIGWLVLLFGVAAAGAAWLGISLRLEEYR